MKHILITSFHGFISRNIFNTDVLKILRADNNVSIIIATQPYKVSFLKKHYGGENVNIVGVDLNEWVNKDKRFNRATFFLQNTNYVQDQRSDYLLKNTSLLGRLKFYLYDYSARFLSRFKIFRLIYRKIDNNFAPRPSALKWFSKYKPDLVFVTDIFAPIDTLFARACEDFNVPVIGMVRSWDNTTTKGLLRFKPTKILVNSQQLKDELTSLHDYDKSRIDIVGLPQFDDWLSAPKMKRDDFCTQNGLDPKKKIILFAPAGAVLSDTDWQLCALFKKALNELRLPSNAQFFIRNHPGHPADLSLADIEGDSRFILDNPGQKFVQGDKDTELSPDDQSHLMNTVYHADVVVYIATSLGLDAQIFNKPQIMISFDGWDKKPYAQSVSRYNREDCLYNLSKTGGVKVAGDIDQLCDYVNAYLKNPSLDDEERKKIELLHMHKIDGNSGRRIAEVIINEVR